MPFLLFFRSSFSLQEEVNVFLTNESWTQKDHVSSMGQENIALNNVNDTRRYNPGERFPSGSLLTLARAKPFTCLLKPTAFESSFAPYIHLPALCQRLSCSHCCHSDHSYHHFPPGTPWWHCVCAVTNKAFLETRVQSQSHWLAIGQVEVAYTFNPSCQETEADRSLGGQGHCGL